MDADRFREALSSRDRVNLLSQQLASFSLEHLLVKFGAIEKFEADEIKTTSKSGEERIRRIIERLLAKVIHKRVVTVFAHDYLCLCVARIL